MIHLGQKRGLALSSRVEKIAEERGYYYHTINSIVVCQIWTNHRHLIMAIALRRRRNYYYYVYYFFIKFLPSSSSFIIFFDALLPLRLFVVYTKACFEPEGADARGQRWPLLGLHVHIRFSHSDDVFYHLFRRC